jgi:hypothetical protein
MINSITHEPITHASLSLMGYSFNGNHYIAPDNWYIVKKKHEEWDILTTEETLKAQTLGDIRQIHLQISGRWLF